MLMWVKFGIVMSITIGRFALAMLTLKLLSDGVFEYALGAFVFAVLSDADGTLARYWGVTTKLGAFLDPVADKVLLVAVVYGLYQSGIVWNSTDAPWVTWSLSLIIPSIVMVIREIATLLGPSWEFGRQLYHGDKTSLRELFAFGHAEAHTRPPSTQMGKWKMGVQGVAISVLISAACTVSYHTWWIDATGIALLVLGSILYWLAGYFTFVTGLDYLRKVVPQWEPPITSFLGRCWVPASLA